MGVPGLPAYKFRWACLDGEAELVGGHVLVARHLGQHAGPEGDDAARAALRVHHRRRDLARPEVQEAVVRQRLAQQRVRAPLAACQEVKK